MAQDVDDDDDDTPTFDATPMPPTLTTQLPAPKRSALNYFASATRRSFRDAFSREQLVAGFKAFLWVAPITALIWVYAEREQVAALPNFPIPIEVTSDNGRHVITVRSLADGNLTADLSGPRAQLDLGRDELARGGSERAQLKIGAVEPGERKIGALAIGDDPRFAANGVVLNNLRPSAIEVFVDVLEDRMIDVRVPDGVTNLAGFSFDPPQVMLSAPRSVLEAASQPVVAYVDAATLQQIKTPGPHPNVPIRVKVPIADPHVVLSPAIVKANLNVKQADETLTLPAIPVAVTFIGKPSQNSSSLVYEESLPRVTVVGAAEQIRAIEAGTVFPRARFEVTPEDMADLAAGGPPRSAQVKYDLPEGVKVKAEDAQRKIEFRLAERGATE